MSDDFDDTSFFQKESPEDYLQAWSEEVAQAKQEIHRKDRGAMVIRLGSEYVAWSGLSCLTVLTARTIHSVPHRPHPVLKGLAAIKGQLIPCFSLARLLDMKDKHDADEQHLILIGEAGNPLGMLVEHIETYIQFHHQKVHALPSNLSKSGECYSQGMLDWNNQKVPLLDESLVISGFERCMK